MTTCKYIAGILLISIIFAQWGDARPFAKNVRGVASRSSSRSQAGQRSLLNSNGLTHSKSQHQQHSSQKQVRLSQLSDDTGDLPPFIEAEVPQRPGAPHFSQQQLPPGINRPGSFNAGGVPNWLNIAGVTVNAVDYGLGLGTTLVAPIVNGVASNVPLLAPALPDGSCLRGSPLFIPRFRAVMCVVGSGAAVTNYLFNAANALVGATGAGLNLATQIAAIASSNRG